MVTETTTGPDNHLIELIGGCQAGDHRAWEELVARYSSRIRSMCRRYARNSVDANDLTQEVFLKIFCAIGNFQPEKVPFEASLLTITHNQLIDHHRRVCRQRRIFSAGDSATREHAGKPSDRPDVLFLRNETRSRVRRALARLSPDLRRPAALHYIHEIRLSEIASMIGIPSATVKSRLHRARSAMARRLKSPECV